MIKHVKRYLIAYTQDDGTDWDQHLTAAEIAFNNSRQTSTGITPFFLNYGRHPHLPLQTALRDIGSSPNPAAVATVQELHDHIEQAKAHLARAQETQKKFADRYRTAVQYNVGDRVFLRLSSSEQRSASLKNKYIGPLDVTAVPSPVNVQLALPPGIHPSTHNVFHVDRLKKYQASPDQFPTRSQNLRPEPDIIDGVAMYEVEDILGERTQTTIVRRRRRSEKQYLVKWKGYTTEEATWEPARAVKAPDVLKRYKDRQREQDDNQSEPTAPQDHNHQDDAKYDSDDDEQDSVD
jgi:hypothetical protein